MSVVRIASAIGDAARAAMLARLLDGRYHTASELAAEAGVAASTASGHLRVLLDAGLIKPRSQGRHRYFMLADADVAHALEALMRVADQPAPQDRRWQRPAMQALREARCCYGHLAGRLGVHLHDALLERGWVRAEGYRLSEAGLAGLTRWGVDTARAATPRALYPCVDWSERREHLAGPLAVALLDAALRQGWLTRVDDSRQLHLTPPGLLVFQRELNWGAAPSHEALRASQSP